MTYPFTRAYEFEKCYGLERLKVTIQKAENAYKSHEPETIDFCKSVLECICKTILDNKKKLDRLSKEATLQSIVGITLEEVGIEDDDLKGSICAIAKSLNEIRNRETICGHGLIGSKSLPSKSDIALFVKNTDHIIDTILTFLDKEDIDISGTKMVFGVLEEKLNLNDNNADIDRSVDIRYEQEEGIIYVDGKEIRPSELMYIYDRTTYVQRLESISNRQFDEIASQLTALLEEELNERFEGFFPGHYGVDDLDIWFTEHKFDHEDVTVSGVVSASARLGSSSDQDGIDVSYESEFKASFVFYSEVEEYELESLKLHVVDWVQPEIDEAN